MKSKLLFAAALVAAGVVGTQAVRLANSSWSLQLLENQQLGGVNPLAADEAEARGVQALSYEGEAVVSGQVYYLYNVGAGKFLEGGSDFGTFATFAEIGVPITFTSVGDNLYTLKTGMGSGFLNAEGWMDQTVDKADLTLTPVDGKENVYNLGTGTAYFGYDGSNAKMSLNVADASSDNAQWILVSKSQREGKLAQATAESGVDASFFIANPNFSRNVNPFGWTDDGSMCAHKGDDGDKLVEIFNKDNADFHQTITGLPNGKYVVSCLGFYRNGDAQPAADSKTNNSEAINSYLYAGSNQAPLSSIFEGFGKTTAGDMEVTLNGEKGNIPNWPDQAASDFRAGIYPRTEVQAIVMDGTLTLGIRKAGLTANDWTLFDSFRLTYYGVGEISEYAETLAAKVNEAHALADAVDGLVPTEYVSSLKEVTGGSYSTIEEYSNAINEIADLIAEVNTVRDGFAQFLSMDEYADKVQVSIAGSDEAKAALTTDVENANTTAFASTDAEVWAAQADAILTACKTYYESAGGVVADGVTDFEVTRLCVVNPGFDGEDPLVGWTRNIEPARTDLGMPYYDNNFGWLDFYQEVSVPNGLYMVSIQGQAGIGGRVNMYATSSNGSSETGLREIMGWMQDGDTKYAEVAPTWAADPESGRFNTGNVLVADGKIRMGVKMVGQGPHGNLYLFFDNFRLVRVNDGLTEITAAYEALETEAGRIVESLPTSLKAELEAALATDPATGEGTAAYYAAYNTLVSVMEECRPVGEVTVGLYALLDECKEYLAHSISSSQTIATFEAAVDKAEGYVAYTDVETLTGYYNDLEAARQAFVQQAAPTGDGDGFDMTFLMTNPDFDGGNANGWDGDAPKQVVSGVPEFWDTGFDMHQTLTNLPAGKYKIDVQARHFGTGGLLYATTTAGTTEQAITASTVSGTTLGNGNLGNEAADMKAEIESGEETSRIAVTVDVTDGSLTVGMKAAAAGSWVVFDDFHITLLERTATDLTLNEAEAYAVTADAYADVTMARSLGAEKWNTFCVPFDMTAEQLEANGITEVVSLTVGPASTAESINLVSAEVTEVKAGMPYLVKVGSDVATISVDGVYVTAAAPAAQTLGTVGDYTVTMTGNYSVTTVPTDAFFISNNMFYVADESANVNLKGFRAYITLTDNSGNQAQANVRSISIDGNTEGDGTTGIDGVTGEEAGKLVDVYTLSGVKVKGGVQKSEALDGLQRGIYIVDGKKVIK